MAGFEIVDTYKAYKVRERKVTTWLKATAAKFGFRGTAKTESASHLIRIAEIPAAVKLIISNGEYVFLVLLFRVLVKYLRIYRFCHCQLSRGLQISLPSIRCLGLKY